MPAILLPLILAVLSLGAGTPATASPLNQWRVSCGADPGAITRQGRTWIFRTSSNHCEGGVFNQRAELSTQHVRPNHRGAYLFQTKVALRTGASEQFTLFQVHDGRMGCAPHLSIDVRPDGRLYLKSDVKTGPGESCIRGTLSDRISRDRITRDGTPYEMRVLIDFDGTGAFDVALWIDGRPQVTGRYTPQAQATGFRPERYYFKHGVYSYRRFPYEMTSSGMGVRRVRVAN